MDGWKYFLICSVLVSSLAFTGNVSAEGEDTSEENPFGGLFDPDKMKMDYSLEWKSLDSAEITISLEMDLGVIGSLFRVLLDADKDGVIEDEEITKLNNPFDDIESEAESLGLEILIDNNTAQLDIESEWTGILGDVNSTDPIGLSAVIKLFWSIDEDLDRHTILVRSAEAEEEDDNRTITEDDDGIEIPFDMTFVLDLPGGWIVDIETISPETMKQFSVDDNTIQITTEDLETIVGTEGEIVYFEIVKGDSKDSPVPLWLPIGALFIVSLSVIMIGRKRH